MSSRIESPCANVKQMIQNLEPNQTCGDGDVRDWRKGRNEKNWTFRTTKIFLNALKPLLIEEHSPIQVYWLR